MWLLNILGWVNHTNLIRNKSELRYVRTIMHNPSIIITKFSCNSNAIENDIKIYLQVFIITLILLLNQGLENYLRRKLSVRITFRAFSKHRQLTKCIGYFAQRIDRSWLLFSRKNWEAATSFNNLHKNLNELVSHFALVMWRLNYFSQFFTRL